MLVLSRRVGESIKIGDDIEVRVLRLKGGAIRLGIDAPKDTPIRRTELKTSDSDDSGVSVLTENN